MEKERGEEGEEEGEEYYDEDDEEDDEGLMQYLEEEKIAKSDSSFQVSRLSFCVKKF